MIVLFTDFGSAGPYVGQMKAMLARDAPDVARIDLLNDLPAFDARRAAYLLAAYREAFPPGSVFLCVVDPGVGGERAPLVLRSNRQWFVGPDNGLLSIAARRHAESAAWTITWRPPALSASFHGRDLFAPVAARLGRGARIESLARPLPAPPDSDWPDDLPEVVYLDPYGNAVTGLRASLLSRDHRLRAGGRTLGHAPTFCAVPPGAAFWYENANGLVEIAVNQGAAGTGLGLAPGSAVEILSPAEAARDGYGEDEE